MDKGRVNAGEGYIGAVLGVVIEGPVARGDCKGTGTGSWVGGGEAEA